MKATTVAVLAVVLLAGMAAAKTRWHQLEGYTFEHYKAEYKKAYATTTEHEYRRQVFEQNLAKIRAHNADTTKTWKEGVNHMSDWTSEEFRRLLGYDQSYGYSKHQPAPTQTRLGMVQLPETVDWRTQGVVTPVKDQGNCGSCWSFGSAQTLESHVAIKTGYLETLSEQNILDCTPNPNECGGTGGCEGGTAELAYDAFAKNGGVQTEWTYPYISWAGKNFECQFDPSKSVINVTGYTKLPSNQYEPLMSAVANLGPIAISVEAIRWQSYEEGVFDGCNQTNPDIDHNVQLVGYGSEDGKDYWLVRNSWTPHWGDHGYIKTVTVCGTCGILFDTVYPTISV
ncbi:uncharacterized protein MONBRDRAFT_33873 [Monosiga brevicollis MX1]|uniref:Uncharacterized protein n=1 Tax=Monosiga brevicollis TaxID=81824 RepID=A9V824_MONBE|nr:uncharacterized protein MONBRDRAFT_33873 [Monosiga brevicollis MX1]EDQ86194.1 predicted protein [Monosiga brevicollis MX1]|eukprot:XP_001748864.1 hypothetical protein [Monosiga brevicollis MX1]